MDDYRKTLESILGIPFSDGNRIQILTNGIEIFPAMLQAIDEAESYINMITYVYWKGEIAAEFAEKLAQKAREGVKVRLILDSIGAFPMPRKLLKMMKKAGVHIRWFRPISLLKFWNMDNRTHRKVMICDGKVGFTGGVGIAKEWQGNARNPSEWRETHFQLQGEALRGLQGAFLENWIETGGEVGLSYNNIDASSPEGESSVMVLRTSASVKWSDILTVFRTMTLMAQQEMRITTAYFDPDPETARRLCDTAKRGVKIDIVMPGKYNDSRMAKIASEDNYRPLLEAGINIWRYQKTMLHAKIITIDRKIACVGSPNFNRRSMQKDDEVMLIISDPSIVAILNRQFGEDLIPCEKIELQAWTRRNRTQRFKEYLVQPFKSEI